jgi:hypothetical protein
VSATPVPEAAITSGELGALLASETEPFTAPAPVGENAILNVVLPPAASVSGRLNPLTLMPEPEAVACEMIRFALPLFVS